MIQHIYKPLPKFAFQQFQVPKFEQQYILGYTISKPWLKFAFQHVPSSKISMHQYIVGYTIYINHDLNLRSNSSKFQNLNVQFQVPKFEHQQIVGYNIYKPLLKFAFQSSKFQNLSINIYSICDTKNIYKSLLKFAFQQFQVPKFEHQYIVGYTIYKPLLKFAFQQFQVPKFECAYIVWYNIYINNYLNLRSNSSKFQNSSINI